MAKTVFTFEEAKETILFEDLACTVQDALVFAFVRHHSRLHHVQWLRDGGCGYAGQKRRGEMGEDRGFRKDLRPAAQ